MANFLAVAAGATALQEAASSTVVAALFDSLIERIMVRMSNDIPSIIENSIKQYAADNMHQIKANHGIMHMNHHGLLLKELSSQDDKKTNSPQTENENDVFFCNAVLKLVDERLRSLEVLQISDLNVALSHLSDAKHALNLNNIKRFKYFIEQSYMKARESLYKIGDLKYILHKVYCYSIIVFAGFFLFSEFGSNLLDGLAFIFKVTKEIQSDSALNGILNKSLNAYYWNKYDRVLVSHCCLFSVKLSSLIRAIHGKLKTYNQNITKYNGNDENVKQLKQLFHDLQSNCTVIKKSKFDSQTIGPFGTDDDDEEEQDNNDDEQRYQQYIELITDLDQWMPSIWTGHFFGVSAATAATGAISLPPKYFLTLFGIKKVDNGDNLWLCESNNCIYEYFEESNMWLSTISDSLLFEYYYHFVFKAQKKLEQEISIDKKYNVTAFNDHFKKFITDEHRLIIRKHWKSLHPKLKLLLKTVLLQNKRIITVLDLSFNGKDFGLDEMKFVCNITNAHNTSLRVLKLAKNDLDFKCIQLLVISFFSILPRHRNYSKLMEINIAYNTNVDDNAFNLLLNKGIALKCPHLKMFYVQWCQLTDLACKYCVQFYENYRYHSLSQLYMNGNSMITANGAIVLNAMLQGLCLPRSDININISDCNVYSMSIKLDKRLII